MIEITFERNDSHPKGEATRTIKIEWVQFTYNIVRNDKDEEIAVKSDGLDGLWFTPDDNETWSDIIISSI